MPSAIVRARKPRRPSKPKPAPIATVVRQVRGVRVVAPPEPAFRHEDVLDVFLRIVAGMRAAASRR